MGGVYVWMCKLNKTTKEPPKQSLTWKSWERDRRLVPAFKRGRRNRLCKAEEGLWQMFSLSFNLAGLMMWWSVILTAQKKITMYFLDFSLHDLYPTMGCVSHFFHLWLNVWLMVCCASTGRLRWSTGVSWKRPTLVSGGHCQLGWGLCEAKPAWCLHTSD